MSGNSSATECLKFDLPWPPSVNTYWRHVVMKGRSTTMLSKAGREFRKTAAGELLAQGGVFTELTGRLRVHLQAFPPDRRKRDLDNLPKSVLDALTHAKVWLDDSQIDDLRITRGHIVKRGLLRVTISPMTSEEL
ncbi:MAG: RusA family crossover junction endodeoxyribonuclease [Candidatus Thiodiazotropha lotti]|nr:RusA family crossover junction endodeoxyribonuclease [Candidatus Thiodiazotropha lotti]MCW4221940.1 RusA family crossover junction endodeoxyribonuclease [Candidatus Thiodiazotropha lotti]